MKVLVTGGAGFIGSHLVDALLSRGAIVKVVDDLSRGKIQNLEQNIDKIEFVKGDLSKSDVAWKAVKDCSVCFHLAAVVGNVDWMNTHPSEIFRSLLINYQVIDACRKMNTEKLLYTSSACIYPVEFQANTDSPPLKETDMLGCGATPDGDYGWAKLVGEIQCKAYSKNYGLKVAIVRPFNPYGPRESFDPKDSHVIPALIRKSLSRENPFVVWGDGGQRRTFTYVTDLVEGIILAIEKSSDAEPINLGESDDTSICELSELILELTGYHTSITFDSTKPQGVRAKKADMTKASTVLGWKPKVPLREGIARTIDWFVRSNVSEQV